MTVLVDLFDMRQSQTIKIVILEGKLLAFADDLFIETDIIKKAEAVFQEFGNLEASELFLNNNKSQIITDQKEMQKIRKIKEINL